MFERPDQIRSPLYVVSALFNPARYRSRWKLFEDFRAHVAQSGAVLYTAEVAFGERAFAIPDLDPARHLQLRTGHELWLKEAILNLLVQRLPPDWRYVAWIDADVGFHRPDWANETLHQLQHSPVVQLWSEALDLSANHEVVQRFRSYAWCYRNARAPGVPKLSRSPASYYYATPQRGTPLGYWHPGYAWAMRRDAFEAVGGLMDWAVLGSADRFMADAAIGQVKPFPSFVGATERRWIWDWQTRLQEQIRGNIGYVEGALSHYWHGAKVNRRYNERGQILVDTAFDPEQDLVRDSQGLWRLRGNKPELRDRLRAYFRARDEDALS